MCEVQNSEYDIGSDGDKKKIGTSTACAKFSRLHSVFHLINLRFVQAKCIMFLKDFNHYDDHHLYCTLLYEINEKQKKNLF